MFKLWINKIPIFYNPLFPMQNLSHLMILQLIRLNTFHGHCCSWWLIDLPFVKYFCSLVQLHYSLLSSFIRKQQLAKYHPAVVLDFWSSLQTTLAQPKDFDRLLLTHLRQRTWYCSLGYLNFPFETWNCFQLGTCFRKTYWPNRLDEM